MVGSLCVTPVFNCLSYVQTPALTRCAQCVSGYSLTTDYLCTAQLPRYCLQGIAGVCTLCQSGYRVYQGVCVVDVPYCVGWNTNSLACSSCDSLYYLAVNGNSYVCTRLPNYCLRADVYGSCLACQSNYVIYNRLCVDNSSILNCQSYDLATFTCLACNPGFGFDNNRRCVPDHCQQMDTLGRCLVCISPYRLVNGICQAIIPNCGEYSTLNGLCLRCLAGYTLQPDGATCTLDDPYCLSYSPTGACQACQTNYYLLQGRCSPLPNGCLSLGSNL
jgi:hypothetical protein